MKTKLKWRQLEQGMTIKKGDEYNYFSATDSSDLQAEGLKSSWIAATVFIGKKVGDDPRFRRRIKRKARK